MRCEDKIRLFTPQLKVFFKGISNKGLLDYRLPTVNYNSIIKILTLTAVINKNQLNKKLLFQAPTLKNNMFNTKYVSYFLLFLVAYVQTTREI